MSPERGRLFPLQMVFALNAIGLAVWFPRIPDVKEALGLDVLTLAFCLFGMPLGTMLGFLIVPRIIARIGLRTTVMAGGAAFLVSFIVPALAWDAVSLGLALFLCGLTIATIEVSMNAKASQTERALGRRIMTRCHAFWSFGTVLGALIGGAFAERGIGFLTQQLLLQPLFAAATIFFGLRLIADEPAPPATPETAGRRGFRLPEAALIAMCLVPIGALLIEGAMMEWSALLMREWKGAGPLMTAVTFSVFALAMAVARLSGDWLAERFGPRPVMLASGFAMAAGIAAFGLAPGLWLSLPAALLVGAGCGNIYPLTMSMVGQLPAARPERNVATLALVAFTAFLIGPPLIGTLAH
ncbi:MAG TPA: MFS transporter, partial [Amaricoccus sp.]|nr:MFS transporter [Amaricoccus sp.]